MCLGGGPSVASGKDWGKMDSENFVILEANQDLTGAGAKLTGRTET